MSATIQIGEFRSYHRIISRIQLPAGLIPLVPILNQSYISTSALFLRGIIQYMNHYQKQRNDWRKPIRSLFVSLILSSEHFFGLWCSISVNWPVSFISGRSFKIFANSVKTVVRFSPVSSWPEKPAPKSFEMIKLFLSRFHTNGLILEVQKSTLPHVPTKAFSLLVTTVLKIKSKVRYTHFRNSRRYRLYLPSAARLWSQIWYEPVENGRRMR